MVKKRQVNKLNELLESKQKLDVEDDKESKVEVICDNKVYINEPVRQLSGLYYLIF